MNSPENACMLEATMPDAVRSCSVWLQERMVPLNQHFGASDAVAILAKTITGDSYQFLVAATEDGIVCGSRAAQRPPTSNTHIWLGYGRVIGDRTDLRLIDPVPFHGWGEHAGVIAEMMLAARVTTEGWV
ncbi:hypothetical protein [Acidipila sp. EB88]|uniref:hypothetical protein n=1 Tax=Acidipila sp. EB88 TaxID=2305226 RepID=UPI000F5ECEF7|nr:hypothetical protein [Acidipila sp. EB88]RRA47598.1 hypothetical protein D1Y84_04120 [Acidipila sp. EB88]